VRIARRWTLLVMAAAAAVVSLSGGTPAFALGGVEVAAPTIDSESASSVTPFDAALAARVTTNNQDTEYHFEYSGSEAEVLAGQGVSVGAGVLAGSLEEQAVPPPPFPGAPQSPPVDLGGGLAPGTTYYYRVVAANASGTTDGAVQSFTTLAAEKPGVQTGSVSSLGELSTEFAGSVNPEFQAVTACEFQYVDEATFNATGFTGTPASLPCTPAAIAAGDSGVGVSAIGPRLAPDTAYYYRLVATNATGTSVSAPQRLAMAHTGTASAVGPYGATIAGSVYPGGAGPGGATSYYFQYGTNTVYGLQTPVAAQAVAQSASAVPEAAALAALAPDTTYYYRLVAVNGEAVSYGEAGSFKTVATPPVLGPLAVGGLGETGATITGSVNAEGITTNWELLLGTTPGSLSHQAAGTSSEMGVESISVVVGALAPGSTHYYKLLATNPDGTTETAEGSFTTSPPPPGPPPPHETPPLPRPEVQLPSEAELAGATTFTTPPKAAKKSKHKSRPQGCARKPKKQRASCERRARKKGKKK
jgi:hypothetical protein